MDFARALLYGLSLPERVLRSASAALGGASKLLTDTILPRSVRNLGAYRSIVGNAQRFLIESLGEVQTGAADPLSPDYLPRKIVGNVADVAGIFAFHVSPLWFLALAGDAAAGAKTWLSRITDELVKDGALPAGTRIETAERLLEALGDASSRSAVPLDTPPLSKEALRELAADLRDSYARLLKAGVGAIPSPEQIWRGVEEIRAREAVPLLRLSGAMAFAATKAVGRASGALFTEKVVRSYAESLAEVRKAGFAPFFAAAARPYLDAVAGAFDVSRRSFTERLLDRRPPR